MRNEKVGHEDTRYKNFEFDNKLRPGYHFGIEVAREKIKNPGQRTMLWFHPTGVVFAVR
jgi:hypothetical protein